MAHETLSASDFAAGYTAAADLSGKQYYIVKVSAASAVNVCGDGEPALGVLVNKPTSGQPAQVAKSGQVKCIASAAISAGAEVASTATGTAVTSTSGDSIIGIAKTAAASANDLFVLEVIRGGHTA